MGDALASIPVKVPPRIPKDKPAFQLKCFF
jgi:hypothetical protein